MIYLKLFETEQEQQASIIKNEYVSYTEETDKVILNEEEFFCRLILNNNQVINIESDGGGTIVPELVSEYSATTVGVEIGKLCTTIGYMAFSGWTSLSSVRMSKSVTTIDEYAFKSCTSLTNLKLSNGLTSIGTNAFNSCTSLKNVIIPSSVKTIGRNAFRACDSLISVTMQDGITSIGTYAFASCISLKNVKLSNTYNEISSACFSGCTSLTSIIIPSSVTTIESGAFQNCSKLLSITSLATIAPSIDATVFQDIKTNGTLYVPSGSSGYDTWMQNANYYLGKYNWRKVTQ